MTVPDVITELTTRAVSEALGVSIETVQMWRVRKSIPIKHWGALIEAFPTQLNAQKLAEAHIQKDQA